METQSQRKVLTSTPVRSNEHTSQEVIDLEGADITAITSSNESRDSPNSEEDETKTLSDSSRPDSQDATLSQDHDVTDTSHDLTASHNSGTQTDDDVTALHETIQAPILGYEVMEQRARFTVRIERLCLTCFCR